MSDTGGYQLVMRSGVAACNDIEYGVFPRDDQARAVGELLLAADKNDSPEWRASDVLPIAEQEPDEALLVSMATRLRHDFGLLEALKQHSMLTDMRRLWEEVVGKGFYSPANRSTAMLQSPAEPTESAPVRGTPNG